jgi:hypothetical protein
MSIDGLATLLVSIAIVLMVTAVLALRWDRTRVSAAPR